MVRRGLGLGRPRVDVFTEHHDLCTIRTVQEWRGHESLATTQKYPELSKETEKWLDAMKLPF